MSVEDQVRSAVYQSNRITGIPNAIIEQCIESVCCDPMLPSIQDKANVVIEQAIAFHSQFQDDFKRIFS